MTEKTYPGDCCCGVIKNCDDALVLLPPTLHVTLTCAQCDFLNQTTELTLDNTRSVEGAGIWSWNGCIIPAPCSFDPPTQYGWTPLRLSLRCCFTGECLAGGVAYPDGSPIRWAFEITQANCLEPFSLCGTPADHDPCGRNEYLCVDRCDPGFVSEFTPPYAPGGSHLGGILCGSCGQESLDCSTASYSPLYLPFRFVFLDGLFSNSKWGSCSLDGVFDGFYHYCCPDSGFGTGEIDALVTE